jgi:hypothetical protein
VSFGPAPTRSPLVLALILSPPLLADDPQMIGSAVTPMVAF